MTNLRGLLKNCGAIAALVGISACGSVSAVAPSPAAPNFTHVGKMLFVRGRPVTAERFSPLPEYARLIPEARASKNYEYIFNYYGSYGDIFDYPKNAKMVGQISGAGGQGCTNVLYGYGKGIIWNAGRTNNLITEYRVPDKPIKTLQTNYDFTSSCAMNESGDLAVGVLLGNSYGAAGQIILFKHASGKGIVYDTPLSKEYFDGYDPKGNLFADGFDAGYAVTLVELPKGAKKAIAITLSNTPGFPGSVQWDGKYVTVFDQDSSETYQYAISGTKAQLVHTVQYSGASDCAQTWLVKGLMYCGDAGNDAGEVFKYPAGGAPVATFTGQFDEPLGATAATK